MKTSQRGHSLDITFRSRCSFGGNRLRATYGLFGMCRQAVPEPGAVLPGRPARAEALGITGAIAGDHLEEFVPVRLAEIVAAFFLVPLQIRIGDSQSEIFGLWYRLVDEFPSEF